MYSRSFFCFATIRFAGSLCTRFYFVPYRYIFIFTTLPLPTLSFLLLSHFSSKCLSLIFSSIYNLLFFTFPLSFTFATRRFLSSSVHIVFCIFPLQSLLSLAFSISTSVASFAAGYFMPLSSEERGNIAPWLMHSADPGFDYSNVVLSRCTLSRRSICGCRKTTRSKSRNSRRVDTCFTLGTLSVSCFPVFACCVSRINKYWSSVNLITVKLNHAFVLIRQSLKVLVLEE